MKALVTGSSGFVGRHLTDHLRSCGDEVVGCDRADGGPDITDAVAVENLFRAVRPEVVFNLAGSADVGGSWQDPLQTFKTNAEGTLNVLLAARAAGVERTLVVASADVYGRVTEDDLPLSEASVLMPVSPYAASKVAADYLALQAALGFGLDVVRVRPFNHIGPGQSERFVAPAIAARIARNEISGAASVPVGNLTPRRDFTDVRDVVRAYRIVIDKGDAGAVYNVCSGTAIAIQELADRLIGMAKAPMQLTTEPSLERPVDIPVLVGDGSRLRAATGWEPQIPLDETLRDLLEYCRGHVARTR
ncbi:MAG: GDP-6-deoxy-D-mannose reductase [Acidimicrobiales bacterium]|nr:GDP-6-deoxy-D-mannose reductase [Acidimicrobiales bacterium]